MLLPPFKNEIDHAFRQDRNLPWKLLCGVVVGLGVGLSVLLDPVAGPAFQACAIGATVLLSVLVVLALSLKDVVHRRIAGGDAVNPLLRLYLASGKVSLVLWIGTALVTTLLACTLWPL